MVGARRPDVSATLVGCETPRIWTPPLRELTRETSLGFEVIEFAESVLGMTLYPWQRWLFIHAMELHEDSVTSDPEPLFRFDTLVVIVGRQQGKTESIKVKKLWRIYVDGAKTVIATAQDLGNSEKAWAEAVVLAQSTPELDAEIGHVDLTHGQKSLRLISGNQYRVASSSRRGGRGWSADDLDLDELREHQTWDSWGAVTPTTLARPRSQVWCWSNAGDVSSVVLWHLRAQAMLTADGVDAEELADFVRIDPATEEDESDIGDSLAIFEWSAHPKAGKWDRQGWMQANPALGHGLVTERKLAAAIRAAKEWVARNEILCQWRSNSGGGPFPEGAWDAGRDKDSRVAEGSKLVACVDVSASRGMGYVAVAGLRPDGHAHVAVTMRRAGTEWIIPWLTAPERPVWAAVTAQTNGAPVSSLVDELRAADLPFVDWAGADLARAFGQVWDLVRLPKLADDADGPADPDKQRLFHWPQPVLDVPAATAVVRKLGDGGQVVDRVKSPGDAAPLVAAIGAAWLLLRPEDKPKRVPQVHDWPEALMTVG